MEPFPTLVVAVLIGSLERSFTSGCRTLIICFAIFGGDFIRRGWVVGSCCIGMSSIG